MTAPFHDHPVSPDPWEPFFSKAEESNRVPRPVKAYLGFLARSRTKLRSHSGTILAAIDNLNDRAEAANQRMGTIEEITAPLRRQQALTTEQLSDGEVNRRFDGIAHAIIRDEEANHPFDTNSPFREPNAFRTHDDSGPGPFAE